MPWAVTVDVFPGVGVDERQIVRANANDLTVYLVELFDITGMIATEKTTHQGNSSGCEWLGARIGGKWVEA
jgi:hypothetical protein